MNYRQFPGTYRKQQLEKMRGDICSLQNNSNQKRLSIKNSVGKKPDIWNEITTWASLGFCIGFFVCCTLCVCDGDNGEVAFPTMGIISVGGAILGLIIGIVSTLNYKKSTQQAIVDEGTEESRCIAEVKSIEERVERDCTEYEMGFENEVQKKSVALAESTLATKIIDLLTKGFSRSIDAADRRAHIEKIQVPFWINVYKDKIECSYGVFDFNLERCQSLSDPVEQTALARVIASRIQLNITMQYPEDATGTKIMINTEYSFGPEYGEADHVILVLTYMAANGNYQPVQRW